MKTPRALLLSLALVACSGGPAETPDAALDGGSQEADAAVADAPAEAATQPLAFATTGALHVARNAHTSTLLPNGEVLVVGGEDSQRDPVASVELYDPSAESWTELGDLDAPRSNHTATLLPNGKVLVVGGGRSDDSGLPAGLDVTASVVLVDPAAPALATEVAPLAVGRSHHVAALLPNGEVLVAGGVSAGGAPLDEAEVYDPAADAWTVLPSKLSSARALATSAVVGGKVVVVGGYAANEETPGTYDVFDPSAQTFSGGTLAAGGRIFGAMVALAGATRAVLVGGLRAGGTDGDFLDDAELFASGAWSGAGSLAGVRDAVALVALPGGRAVSIGGFTNDPVFEPLADVSTYDPSASAWGEAGKLNVARSSPTATLLADGRILVAGGFGAASVLASCELSGPVGP